MRAVHPQSDGGSVRIGAKLRASRQAQGLTLEQLASASGLTKGFVSRIERDETMPSVPTLVQLCQALSLQVGALFEEPDIQLVRRDSAPRINMGGSGVEEWLVTPRAESGIQVIRSSLSPGASGGEPLYTVNCDLEVLHVVSGEITLILTDREIRLTSDDTLTFPGRTPHSWSAGDAGAEIAWILIPAAWSGSA